MNGNFQHDFLNLSAVSKCFGKPAGTNCCGQWQSGIGNPADGSPSFPCTTTHCVGLAQYSAASQYNDVSYVALAPNASGLASSWTDFPGIASGSALSPSGDGVPSPVLYEGQYTLNPCSVTTAAYVNSNPSAGGYDCWQYETLNTPLFLRLLEVPVSEQTEI